MNLGLGLYFCRMVAEAHGGTLSVEETQELPTVFSLCLPVVGRDVASSDVSAR
jgi:signal transduction histidine kinase